MSKLIKIKNITSKYHHICYVGSMYSLFLYFFLHKNKKNTLFIVHNNLFNRKIFDSLDNYCILNDDINITAFDRLKFLFFSKFKLYNKEMDFLSELSIDKKMSFYGHDHLPLSFLFDNNPRYILEDGLSNYFFSKKRDEFSYKIKKYIKSLIFIHRDTYGYSKDLIKLYLSSIIDIPDELIKNNKIEIFSLNEFSEYIKCKELDTFNIRLPKLLQSNLLLTQPLSEDLIISENEKIKLYRNIILLYPDGVIIKPHPRELTDYKKVFKDLDVVVIDNVIPVEFLIDDNSTVNNVITIYSSAAYNLKKLNNDLNVTYLGEDYIGNDK